MKINFKKVLKNIFKPRKIFFKLRQFTTLKKVEDKKYLEIEFRSVMNYKLNLNNPITFNEKLQWLKLYDRKEKYINMVDKIAVKEIISKEIGSEYVIPTLKVWDDPDDINIDDLPDQFVLKCNHDSGSIFVCKNKNKFNLKKAKKVLKKQLNKNFYYQGREWPYKNVKPRVLCEKYMTDNEEVDAFTDYKFFCFDGYVDCVMVCIDRNINSPKFYFFDSNWKLKKLNYRGLNAPENFSLPKPKCIDEMFEIAGKLSKGIPFVRIDLYQSNNQIYFGEFTFYPSSGFDSNLLKSTDEYFGSLISIKRRDLEL